MAIRELVRNPALLRGSAPHIRRCNFRRMALLRGGAPARYEVECLGAERAAPLPLGDLETARPVCDTCEATNIFRPDED